MHITECHIELAGYDDRLVRAGVSVYLQNLCRQFQAAGHQVTGLTAAHGLLPWLRGRYQVADLGWRATDAIPVRLDPGVWPGFPAEVVIPADVTAHRLRAGGLDIVLLAGGLLDELPGCYYPPPGLEGRDLSFLKPLVFQVMATRFLRDTAPPGSVVHLHEPSYHYLMPAALRQAGLVTVSSVQTNLPPTAKVYGPEVRALLRHLGADPALAAGLADPLPGAASRAAAERRAMRWYPAGGPVLCRACPERPGHDYLSLLGLVARSAHALDFLSAGQLEHTLTQAGTPFEPLFQQLALGRELRSRAHSLVVGGCAIGAGWLGVTRSAQARARTLRGLGLDPALPTVYHNARYSPQHKGQQDMFRALHDVLGGGVACNVLLHCLAAEPPADPDLDALAARYPALVRVRTGPMGQPELMAWAAASDLCLFPAKFEMDTFLIAMGEAMAAGAVPIATAQLGLRHYGHAFDLSDPAATGLALPRSFRAADPELTAAISAGLRHMLRLAREQPGQLGRLRARAMATARALTWDRVGARFLDIFAACAAGRCPAAGCPRPGGHPVPVDAAAVRSR